MPLESYDREHECEVIQRRYTNTLHAIPYTLERLQCSPAFLKTVHQLRAEGWKDWHILIAVLNGVINWRSERTGENRGPQQYLRRFNALFDHLMEHGESPDDPLVPPEYFTVDTMRQWLDASIVAMLKQKGGVLRPRGYDPKKLRRIAERRYHYFELDVPHQPLFPDEPGEPVAGL